MNWKDRVAVAVHAIHGTRGLAMGAAGLLLLGLIDPLIPAAISRAALVAPVFIVLVIGAATLAREGVAMQSRTRSLIHYDSSTRRLLVAMMWPALLLILLAPRLFLMAYGVPHLSPLTGLVNPDIQRSVGQFYLFATVLVAVATVRVTRSYARHIIPKRPRDLRRDDRSHQERDGLLWMGAGIAMAYAFTLQDFWAPFSLLQWPPGLDSLTRVRGVAAITFTLTVPLLLFTALAAYAALLRRAEDPKLRLLALVHLVLLGSAVALHAYNLLWIAQYRAAAPF